MSDQPEALRVAQALEVKHALRPEPVVCLVGAHSSAFDLRTTKRAYTYAEQPGNVAASKLGLACAAAASQSAGDRIDRGLALLQELQNQGFGVFALGAEYTAPPEAARLLREQHAEIERLREALEGLTDYDRGWQAGRDDAWQAYQNLCKHCAVAAEIERLRDALREIADETYDVWTNGAKAQRIAESALKEVPR